MIFCFTDIIEYFSGGYAGPSSPSKPLHLSSLTILGLQLTMLPIKTMGYFSDKKEIRMFASALGYVAHVRCHFADKIIFFNCTICLKNI